MGWRTRDNPPTRECDVLGFDTFLEDIAIYHFSNGHYLKDEFIEMTDCTEIITHWMPLPQPPI